jgi:hypothetical protein
MNHMTHQLQDKEAMALMLWLDGMMMMMMKTLHYDKEADLC